jgi:cobalt-zinc-cadmium efflux system outer membrane protein
MKRFLVVVAVLAAGCASPPEPVAEPTVATDREPAQVQPASRLTLERALALAESHPELAESQSRIDAAKGRSEQAGAWPDPALVVRREGAGTDASEEYLAGIEQALPLGGRLGAARRSEELERGRLEFELEARRRAVRARVHAAFTAALYSEQAFALLKESAAAAEGAVALASSLAAAGEGMSIDVSRARVELAKARIERDRAASLAKEALIALESAIGRPSLAIESLEGSLESAIEFPALESLAAELADHPTMKAARAGVEVHEVRLDLARARRIPDVNLELLYRRVEQTEEDGLDVGVSITLPIFNGNRGGVREARSERRAAQARAEMSAIELSRDLRQSHARLSRSLDASRAIKEGLVNPQDEIARAFEARYAAGDASLTEVLPVRRERIAVRLAHLEALRDVMEAWASISAFVPD